MILSEMFDKNPIGYSTEKDDQTTVKANDQRKTKLTLSHIKRLRIMNDIRKLELAKKMKRIQAQYSPEVAGGEGGMGGLGI